MVGTELNSSSSSGNKPCYLLQNSGDLNMSHVTQHSVPIVLMQDQHDDLVGTCGDLINSADKDGMFLNWIITGEEIWCFQKGSAT
jgi:hypothetical protein